MTPTLLAEYIASVGLTLTGLIWLNVFIAGLLGVFDKE